MKRYVVLLRRHWLAGYMGLVLVLGLVSLLNLTRDIGRPFGGFRPTYDANKTWYVDESSPSWWLGIQAGLRPYDELLTLNGQPYTKAADQQYAEACARQESSANVTVRRGGQELSFTLPIERFSWSEYLDLKLSDLICGWGLWLLALAIYRASSTATLNRVTALLFTIQASSFWLIYSQLVPGTYLVSNFLYLLEYPFGQALPLVVTLHFIALFPEPLTRLSARFWRKVYIVASIVAALNTVGLSLVIFTPERSLGALPWSSLWNGVFWYAVPLLFFAVRFAWLWRQPTFSRRRRRQLLILALGFLSYLPVIASWSVGEDLPDSLKGLDLRYLLQIALLAIAYIILRYKAFQSSSALLIAVTILASSAIFAALGSWLIRAALPPSTNFGLPPMILFLGPMLGISTFWGTRSLWQSKLRRWFQREQHSLASVRSFGQHLIGQHDVDHLAQLIVDTLVSELAIEQAALWLWNDCEAAYSLASRAGTWDHTLPTRLLPGCESIAERWTACLRPQRSDFPEWLAPLRQLEVVEVVAPLPASGHILGLLAVGKRWDEEIFDERDLEIIELIAQQAALFLLTAWQIDELRQVPQRIAQVQEHERFRIAQELHDTVQQFLGRLPFDLEVCCADVRTDPDETEAILQHCLVEVEETARVLRQIRNDLAPHQLEAGLSQPLRDLTDRFGARTGLETKLEFEADVDVRLSVEARHALYRVIQQALDNIRTHAQAHHVSVALTMLDHHLHFGIVDDGRGFSTEQKRQPDQQGGFGLKSMEARIAALGGELQIVSGSGKGTQVIGWLPIATKFPRENPEDERSASQEDYSVAPLLWRNVTRPV